MVRAAAGMSKSIFITEEGVGYWSGEGSGELQNVGSLVLEIIIIICYTNYCKVLYCVNLTI